ncbi:heparinase II/III family protein [Roseinatronobacter sp. HJB301]|uniref:Heparinase II/III family protein n=2 Tax=Roseinatronobacter alkalisoli TaxID=3028235 RepID=A0ABT5TDK3_9RHOB|nr:heparinase II/III family protein [Roseinatronobacter sp. HJB301]MDD7972451.1 heparinase II/III family protein [Roseinatronobacter sp. HJB301]
MDRLAALLLARGQPVTALVAQPQPRGTGQFARGKQMLAGNFLMAGELLKSGDAVPFRATTADAVDALHGFDWLNDLAAVGDQQARKLAQKGLADWLAQFGRGQGPGWVPGVAGRRLLNWLSHAVLLMQGQEKPFQDRFLRALAHHAGFLVRRAGRAAPGLPRIAAHTGLLFAALSLEGWERRIDPTAKALLADCNRQIDNDGGIATRSPEDLLQIFVLLSWTAQTLDDLGRAPDAGMLDLLSRLGRALRALRHADGGLARFHGGGRGNEADLVAALAMHDALYRNPVAGSGAGPVMGFARLAAGRSTVLVDAAPPPVVAAPSQAHASTLAFELTSNRRPVIVSCGDGTSLGVDWQRASRASASHSTLSIDGYSSARFTGTDRNRLKLTDGPRHVGCEFRHTSYSRAVALSHDGYIDSHGLEHTRFLDLSADGRVLSGEDMLISGGRTARKRFDDVLVRTRGAGIAYSLRFHLHPEVEASVDMNGTAVSIMLRSGEIWVFRAEGHALTLAPSVYLEKARLKPRASLQIVLSLRAQGYTSQVNWVLAKAQDTPLALRDTMQENPLAVPEL